MSLSGAHVKKQLLLFGLASEERSIYTKDTTTLITEFSGTFTEKVSSLGVDMSKRIGCGESSEAAFSCCTWSWLRYLGIPILIHVR